MVLKSEVAALDAAWHGIGVEWNGVDWRERVLSSTGKPFLSAGLGSLWWPSLCRFTVPSSKAYHPRLQHLCKAGSLPRAPGRCSDRTREARVASFLSSTPAPLCSSGLSSTNHTASQEHSTPWPRAHLSCSTSLLHGTKCPLPSSLCSPPVELTLVLLLRRTATIPFPTLREAETLVAAISPDVPLRSPYLVRRHLSILPSSASVSATPSDLPNGSPAASGKANEEGQGTAADGAKVKIVLAAATVRLARVGFTHLLEDVELVVGAMDELSDEGLRRPPPAATAA